MQKEAKTLTTRYNWLSLKIVTEIIVCVAWDQARCRKIAALRDTGATTCAIHGDVAKEMWLIAVGKKPIWWVHGTQDANYYIIDIILPNNVWIPGLEVVECNTPEGFIIGMNVICFGDMCISNHEWKTVMTFVLPSQRTTDYVNEWNTKHGPKISSSITPIAIHSKKAKGGHKKNNKKRK